MSAAAASLALQKALFARLHGDAALMAEASGVHDGVPAGAALPYVTIGPDIVSDAGWKGGTAFDHRLTVTAWVAGTGAAGAKALMALVETALAGLGGTVDGWRVAWVAPVRGSVVADPGGVSKGLLELRARTVAL